MFKPSGRRNVPLPAPPSPDDDDDNFDNSDDEWSDEEFADESQETYENFESEVATAKPFLRPVPLPPRGEPEVPSLPPRDGITPGRTQGGGFATSALPARTESIKDALQMALARRNTTEQRPLPPAPVVPAPPSTGTGPRIGRGLPPPVLPGLPPVPPPLVTSEKSVDSSCEWAGDDETYECTTDETPPPPKPGGGIFVRPLPPPPVETSAAPAPPPRPEITSEFDDVYLDADEMASPSHPPPVSSRPIPLPVSSRPIPLPPFPGPPSCLYDDKKPAGQEQDTYESGELYTEADDPSLSTQPVKAPVFPKSGSRISESKPNLSRKPEIAGSKQLIAPERPCVKPNAINSAPNSTRALPPVPLSASPLKPSPMTQHTLPSKTVPFPAANKGQGSSGADRTNEPENESSAIVSEICDIKSRLKPTVMSDKLGAGVVESAESRQISHHSSNPVERSATFQGLKSPATSGCVSRRPSAPALSVCAKIDGRPLPPVPANGVQPSLPAPPLPTVPDVSKTAGILEDLSLNSWYVGEIDRKEAEAKIRVIAQDGAFVVRKSQNGGINNPYTLTLLYGNNPYNLHIRRRTDGKFAIGNEKPDEIVFPAVPDLVKFYVNNVIDLIGDSRRNIAAGRVMLKISI